MATKKTVTNVEETKAPEIQENEALKAQIETMQQQMAQMQEMFAKMQTVPPVVVTTVKETLDLEQEIPVVSQCFWQLNLSTHGFGKGNVYTFDSYGEIIDIPYGDLKRIVQHEKSFTQGGAFYILSEKAVEALRLKSVYKKILDVETLEKILTKDAKSIIEAYKLAPNKQKETIVSMIVQKKLNKEKIDANVLVELGELCGRDLTNIENPLEIPID